MTVDIAHGIIANQDPEHIINNIALDAGYDIGASASPRTALHFKLLLTKNNTHQCIKRTLLTTLKPTPSNI